MVMWRALVLLVLVALVAQGRATPLPREVADAPAPAPAPAPKADTYRLPPQNIVPSNYKITLEPQYNAQNGLVGITKFKGTVVISATVGEGDSVSKITLNCDQQIVEDDIPPQIKVLIASESTTTDSGNTDSTPTETTVTGSTTDPSTPTTSEPSTTPEDENSENNSGNPDDNPFVSGRVRDDGGKVDLINIFQSYEYVPKDLLEITLSDPITENTEFTIEITYWRRFVDGELSGFYRSNYKDKDGKDATVLATQFEPTSARKAFPCFDEPLYKATFDLSIKVTANTDAIANTFPKGTPTDNLITFETTPVMSTYLLAFVVFEKASFSTQQTATATFRTFGRTEALEEEKGALSQIDGPAMIKILADYTDIEYYNHATKKSMGLAKMDQAAIPDFSSGAMENWGLVTYRESALLFSKNGATAAKKRVSQVIAHELAHQWFGNWVTTNWWNTIWLNEGFADLFEYEVMDKHYGTSWKMPERMVLDEQMYAFDVDSDSKSPALTLAENAVNSPEEISGHFGTITYSKGGSILRQIRNVLGVTKFQTAIKEYLAAMEHKAAKPEHLFEHLTNNNDAEITLLEKETLEEVLINWTEKPGYPVLTVKKDGNKITVKQERFLLSTSDAETTKTYYDVYLTWVTDKDANTASAPLPPKAWLKSDQTTEISVEVGQEDWTWILVNPYQAGYYRVDYSTDLWEALRKVLDDHDTMGKVSNIDRAALINNALNLVREKGERNMKYDNVFTFMLFLKHDTAFEPWAATRASLAHVQRMSRTETGYPTTYKAFINNIIEAAYKAYGFAQTISANDNVQNTHRVNVLTLACGAKHDDCQSEARSQLNAYLADNTKEVNVNLQSVVYCYGLKDNKDAWDKLWVKYAEAVKDQTRRQLIASALGCVDDSEKLKEYLAESLKDNSVIPASERYLVFSAVYANPDGGPEAALDFLDGKNLDDVNKAYDGRLPSLLNGLASYLTTEEQQTKLAKVVGTDADKYSAAITTVTQNIAWKKDNQEAMTTGLQRAGDATAASLATGLLLLCAAVLRLIR